ncbi:ZIP zinc transporter [Polychaeton citri CBS 116435]|uniref:ZIP zinc transporter n=1 Tax=Polychaeton citri CBS 116435 TaxID=1314669 RepID=A0A9P4Q825_9PEZI|nr:ZIP zinc transporter [Polychaeton citri CBS 116435]
MYRGFVTLVSIFGFWSILTIAQTYTLTGCHAHGNVEFCYLPNGEETPWTTYSSAAATNVGVNDSSHVTPAQVTKCHFHQETQFCMASGEEWEVINTVDKDTAPEHYQNCHAHEEELHCTGENQDVALRPITAESSDSHEGEESSNGGVSCHDHAGVPHCVDADGNTVDMGCSRPEHEYNVPLRIGLLFVILATSAIGVYLPIITSRFSTISPDHTIMIAMQQLATGIIISTAIVHLFTHAELYFSNDCLTGLDYEATAGAILMAGLFITFVLEKVTHHLYLGRGQISSKQSISTSNNASKGITDKDITDAEIAEVKEYQNKQLTMSASVMEAGIIFHSILIGVTLVVASESTFITLFIVIIFHQMFEGLALGARIAIMPASNARKLILGLAFAVTTPIGMAIGVGVLSKFNGNDPATIIAIGTLNAFSAGILLWVGLVEMWFEEWWHGALAQASALKTFVGGFSLITGLVVMSVLGKWA